MDVLRKDPELPDNFGQCFDVTALYFVRESDPDARLCHGIGVANLPSQKGQTIKHAWIERDGEAFDCVWEVRMPADRYRRLLRISYVVEYTLDEVWKNWNQADMPGPWDEKIATV